jgi:dTDP-4-dehydrorhamnose reductase
MSTAIEYPYCKPEIWGGIECTINRVNNIFRDQLRDLNHYERASDIEQIAGLGIRKLRYPLLWERHQPAQDGKIDWRWSSNQLDLICRQKIVPIAGLLHHGSGPVYTNLNDQDFPVKLGSYASLVAKQFPWLSYYTPVNEPLTTARFSGLYGFWYPHQRCELSFFDMVINQVKGIVCSMKAIRKINPSAKLVQTEDLGKTHSTPLLRYQTDFENIRRWLTYDLLCGRIEPHHYFWKYLLKSGITERRISFFLDNPCPPDIMGFNYYVTSERYLDEHVENYPEHLAGGNNQHRYVDTEAVRTNHLQGLPVLLKEAWNRYHLPIAITECHLNCTREEQLRWLKETWDTCCQLQKEGIDLKAVTAWALLGAYDWNSLLTEKNNHYEAGAFCLRNNSLRPTALSKMIQSLSIEGVYDHPLVAAKGWWNRNEKMTFQSSRASRTPTIKPLMIIGTNGTLGHAFTRICEKRSIAYKSLTRGEINILSPESIDGAIEKFKPWAIINAAGYVRVDDAEQNCDECFAINAKAPTLLAKICLQKNVRFMTFSSDLVFDGNKQTPYHEADQVRPLNIYGASKAEAERTVLDANPSSLIIRTSAFFGPWDKFNFAYAVLEALQNSSNFYIPKDVFISPTYVPDLVNTALDLFIDEETGIWHVSNEGGITWEDFAGDIASRAGYEKKFLLSKPLCEMGWKAKRPEYSVLQSERGIKLPTLDKALERYFGEKLH